MAGRKGKLDLICERVGIRIRNVNHRRVGPQTHARHTLKTLLERYGQDHLVLVLKCIRESKGNEGEAWSDVIMSISDVLLIRPEWASHRIPDILDALDNLDLKALRAKHFERKPWNMRQGIRTDILNHLEGVIDAE